MLNILKSVIGVKLTDLDDFIREIGTAKKEFKAARNGSIVERAAGGIFQFPILISDDIPINAASILSQSIEIEYANLLTIGISLNPKVKINDLDDAAYIKKIHTNIKKLESALPYSVTDCEYDEDTAILEATINNIITDDIPSVIESKLKLGNREANKDYYESQGAFFKSRHKKKKDILAKASTEPIQDIVTDIKSPNVVSEIEPVQEIPADNASSQDDETNATSNQTFAQDDADEAKAILDRAEKLMNDSTKFQKDKIKSEKKLRKEITKKANIGPTTFDAKKYSYEKVNDLQPYPVEIKLQIEQKDGTLYGNISTVICGIKAHLHPITRKHILDTLPGIMDDSNLFIKVIRWTTGEIKFFKDVFLNIDRAKLDAISTSEKKTDTGGRWLTTLKQRARTSKIERHVNITGNSAQAIPNGTLILSKQNVNMLKSTSGFDILDPKTAKTIADKLFLINIIILDESTDTVHIIKPETDVDFHKQSLSTLKSKVNASQDAALTKELRKIITR
jgi:hypothetical protein